MEDVVAPRLPVVRGRGAVDNPKGRFEKLDVEVDPDPEAPLQLKTELFKDTTRKIIATNDSPDIGFGSSLNPYRGCEHGCIYCYARPTHEYFGLSAGLDFETKIFAKTDAPMLLREQLASPRWEPQTVVMSGVTDCYQPTERKLKVTRSCLEVFAEFRNPVAIITKNHLVTRDIDVLSELATYNAVRVMISITTLNKDLARVMEPRASRPELRLDAVKQLHDAGIQVGVMIAPIIPGLTDHEVPKLLEACAKAGALAAGHTVVRLPYGVKELFQGWLDEHHPLRKSKILSRIREVRGGKLNDARFGTRMRGEGEYADSIEQMFQLYRKKAGLDTPLPALSTGAFRRNTKQLALF